jgi:16S rRNA (guanine527-N7)-methyltransferase
MTPGELLKKGLYDLRFAYTDDQIHAFLTYLSELRKWNRAYSLTALKTDEDIIVRHFLDSVLYLRAIPSNALKIADVGTGAGFPGLPIKIISPQREITLIEASRKKTSFLRNIIRILNLQSIRVVNERIENLGESFFNTFDAIVSRATFKTKGFIDCASRYLKESGCLVLSKGPAFIEELEQLKNQEIPNINIKVFQCSLFRFQRNLLVIQKKSQQ